MTINHKTNVSVSDIDKRIIEKTTEEQWKSLADELGISEREIRRRRNAIAEAHRNAMMSIAISGSWGLNRTKREAH